MKQSSGVIEALRRADQYVNNCVESADGHSGPYPWWHGWALRQAFLAGADWYKNREISPKKKRRVR